MHKKFLLCPNKEVFSFIHTIHIPIYKYNPYVNGLGYLPKELSEQSIDNVLAIYTPKPITNKLMTSLHTKSKLNKITIEI